MTRWFVIFLISLLIVLGARYGTYSPLPKAVFVDCDTPVTENKLQGLWELDRIYNYEAFHEGLESNSGILSYLEISVYPFILARSQLYRIEQWKSGFPPAIGSLPLKSVFLSFFTKAKRDQAFLSHVYGKIWLDPAWS